MNGPWEDYGGSTAATQPQPGSPSPTDSQGPWADYADPSTAAPQGFSDAQKHQIKNYIPKAKDGADLEHFARSISGGQIGVGNADEVVKYYKDYQKVPENFSINPAVPSREPPPEPSAGDYIKGAVENVGRGIVHGLGFIDDAINPFSDQNNPFHHLHEIAHDIEGKTPTKAELAANAGPGFFEKNAGDVYDSIVGVRKPKNTLQRYVNAASQGAGSALIPIGGGLSTVRGVTGALTAGAVGGVGSQAASDAFPNSPLAPLIGGIVGAHIGGTPFALKPIKQNAYLADASQHPEAPYVPAAAQALATKAADVAPNGLTPKGRGKLTVSQINAVAKQPLMGMPDDLNRLVSTGDLDPAKARDLKLAIQNKDGITAEQIAALRGTPEGDAVAEALQHYRAVSNLTKPYGGDGRGIAAKTWNGVLGWTPGLPPKIANLLMVKPGDVNAARIRGADKAIDNLPLYQRLASKVGPSPVGPALDTFQQRVADSYTNEAQSASSAADAKASRFGMTDNQFANYSARSSSAGDALSNAPVPAPRSKSAQSALNKYQKAADTSSTKLDQFDQDLNAPAPPPKRSPEDLAIQNNMDQGLKGYHRAYADAISAHLGVPVQPADVLAALKKADVSDVDPFQLQKFEMEHRVSPAAKAALLPRIENVLRQDKSVMARTEAPAAPKPAAQPAPKATPKAATPAPEAPPPQATATEPQDPNTSGNYRDIRRRPNWDAEKARRQAAFDSRVEGMSGPNSPHSQEIVSAAQVGLDHIRNGEKTVESAMRYFDDHLGPELRSKDFLPEEIADLRKDVEKAAVEGKRYQTDAEFEKGAKVGPRGRPRKPPPASDDVPF